MFLLLAGCAPPALQASLQLDPVALEIHASVPVDRVQVVDATGTPVVRRSLPEPRDALVLRAPFEPGTYQVHLVAGEQSTTLPVRLAPRGPATVELQAPLGQGAPGEVLELPDGRPVRAGIVVEAHQPVLLTHPQGERRLQAGEREVLVHEVGEAGLHTWLALDGTRQDLDLPARAVPLSVLRERLEVEPPRVPARADGWPDPTLPSGRITLPAPWWDHLLDRLALGFRARDDLAPRTHLGVALTNRADEPVHAVVDLHVEVDGRPHPAFRPRTREATDLTTVRRLVRVPPHETVHLGLPVYLDREAVTGPLLAEAVVGVRPLGAPDPLHVRRTPLVVDRGDPRATGLFVLGLLSALGGALLAGLRFRTWIDRPSRDLTTIAVFGALSFVVGTASQVVGLGVASVLGPFAPFVLGLVDDAVRVCLLATLLTLVPRSGVLSLALLLGWLMRALALGAAHPVDALYLGASVLWLETGAALAGLSRGRVTLLRLWLGLVLPNALLTALALAVSMVLYRLYYADAYVLALVLGPGLLYPAAGCLLAVPFAASLRRVAP